MEVAICIATCQRPNMLDKLLKSISKLNVDFNLSISLKIIIVDNDLNGTARSVFEYWYRSMPWPVIYEKELRRGIPYARNRLVKIAKGADFIAFIDDDEIAHKNWLKELIHVQMRYDADIVAGPVLPIFEFKPPKWIAKGLFFSRKRHATGTSLTWAATGNILIKQDIIFKMDGPFKEKFGRQGGTDFLMTKQLHRQFGAKIIWANDAIVAEVIPKSRVKRVWLYKRAFRAGNSLSMCDSYLFKSKSWILIRFIKGLGKIFLGFLYLIPSLFSDHSFAVKAVCDICQGVGTFSGILGITYNEYKKIHGA